MYLVGCRQAARLLWLLMLPYEMNYLLNLCWCSFQLQDLASSPGIRNPELNNAECVIEGHGTDMQATGRSLEIRIMIWGSFCFICAGFEPLYEMTVAYMKVWKDADPLKYHTLLWFSVLVGILGSFIWLILLSVVIYFSVRDGPLFYLDILIVLIPVLYFITPLSKRVRDIRNSFRSDYPDQMNSGFMWFQKLLAPISVIYTCFFSCSMLIGIVLNPIWGLTVALAICLVISFFIYIVAGLLCTGITSVPFLNRIWVRCFLALTFLTIVVIFAGQSFNGRETSDGIFNTVLFTSLLFLTSWLLRKTLFSRNSMVDPLIHLKRLFLSRDSEWWGNSREKTRRISLEEITLGSQPSFSDFDESTRDQIHSIDSSGRRQTYL